ncbi:hypothetical protein K8640_36195 [Myxococcus sp. XM-1-1-1]|uniref:hypothetical protein n=1 Tax=Myxococcus sp. XM-1-1-1 TaxID=2874602 RepID=UPI001CBE5C7D|nr:hypothetical protein [Myxococcus sp. XM-1-1-1]MBZ4413681.1 hypothetical protein [Myxococcus sp. XM-1-1-1]
MRNGGWLSPVERVRRLALSLERLAAHGLASGAVSGATEGLQEELPALDGTLKELIQDTVLLLARTVHEANEHAPGAWTHTLAESAVRSAVEELRRSMPGVDLMSRELVERMNGWLERTAETEALRRRELRKPGARARTMATGAVRGAVKELEHDMEMVAPMAAHLASRAGQGLIEGLSHALEARSERLDEVLERAGRRFVHSVVEQLALELKARREGTDLGGAVAAMAERTAVATVRGASEELRRQGRAARDEHSGSSLRAASRDVTLGVLSALSEHLRRPFAVVAGTGGALMLTALTLKRWR